MTRTLCTTIVFTVLLVSCNISSHNEMPIYGPLHQIDSILDAGGNPYDVASYLQDHMETLYLNLGFSQGDGYSVVTSADGNLRVYSVYDWPGLSFPQIKNIFHYRDGENDEDIHIKADEGDWGCISSIGTTKNDSKRYYVLLSDYYSEIHGTFVVTMVSVYSLDEQIYDSLKREQSAFLTKSGRHIDSIEVRWNDYSGYSLPDNYWGISMDNLQNTREIYVQVVDAKTGNPLDKAIVYRWNKNHFEYSEIRPMKIERIIE